ncbi:MAG: hypothetical protein IPO09_05065 [Anaeromyxobacter sp.]|nr:hypothetical protein [Anaeromyxobacter sp.]MBL0277480.1 hypothetical protein [Anaeromyxobacter sp.]
MRHAARPTAATLLDGLEVPAFLCRPDAGVVAANGPAGALLAGWARAPFDRPAGELMGCLNARDAGCGRGPRCAQCPVRAAIAAAIAGGRVDRVPVAMVLVRDGAPCRVELRVSASPAEDDGQALALLTLEPAEWVR